MRGEREGNQCNQSKVCTHTHTDTHTDTHTQRERERERERMGHGSRGRQSCKRCDAAEADVRDHTAHLEIRL